MKFDKLLHPEVMLGKRGDKFFQKFYKETVHGIKFTGFGMEVGAVVNAMNLSQQRSLALMQRFRIDQGKVFHVAKDFLEALAGVERGVSLKYLPERFVGYISFADKVIADESEWVEGAYVYIGPAEHTMLKDTTAQRVFWCAYMTQGYQSVGTVCVELKDGDTMEDLVSRVELDNNKRKAVYMHPDAGSISARACVFNTVLNCVMYVHSAEPNVQRVPSADSLTNRKAAEIREKTGIKNTCTLSVTFLNWNYAKQRVYNKDSTWVNSFPRWQPCGPQWSQVKLIWVTEHSRKLKSGGDDGNRTHT